MRKIFAIAALALALTANCAPAKYVFYFIGDGMGNGHVMSTMQYNRLVRHVEEPLVMTTFPVMGVSTTYSASSPVTDSAAAGTALAAGVKTINGMLGVAPDSSAVVSVATKLHDAGYGVGLVTTVAPDDATPGAFYAHQPSRKMYYEIGIDYANSDFEFLAGSGLRGLKDKEGNTTDLLDVLASKDVAVVRGAEALEGVGNRRVVLLNTDTIMDYQVGFTIDSIKGGLTLPVMTRECLNHLMRVSPDAFFMMVEGGNIDYAGHANDGGAAIKEILKFDEALRIAYDFYLDHPDETLIVVTADHDTGGMALGNQYVYYNANLHYFDAQRVAKDTFSDRVKMMLKSRRVYTWPEMKEMLREELGFWTVVPVTDEQTDMLEESFRHTFIDRDDHELKSYYKKYPGFVHEVFNVLQDHAGIGWTTLNHTGNPVHVYAIGAGADLFKAINDNTSIPAHILEATGR